MRTPFNALFLAVLFLAACNAPATPDPQVISQAVQATLTAMPTATPRVIEVTRVITAIPEPTVKLQIISLTAEEILLSLKQTGLPIGDYVNYTAENDINQLLGRPMQYTSKVNFYDNRLEIESPGKFDVQDGGSIEIFGRIKDAEQRAEYLREVTSTLPFTVEYDIVYQNVLLRLSHRLTPEQAREYENTLRALQ